MNSRPLGKQGVPFKKGADPRRNMAGHNGNPEKKGPGRKLGGKNKTTQQVREAFMLLVSDRLDDLDDWLDEIKTNDGALQAMKVFLDLAEFCVPKIARVEMTGVDGEPVKFTEIRRVIVDPKPNDS